MAKICENGYGVDDLYLRPLLHSMFYGLSGKMLGGIVGTKFAVEIFSLDIDLGKCFLAYAPVFLCVTIKTK